MIFALKAVVASALVASILAAPLPTGTHQSRDPCTILSALDAADVSYVHVKACYEHIPYHIENNARIMESLPFFYEQFWAYKGAALIPSLGSPFDTRAVDIFAEFNNIAATKFTSDHAFHEAMRLSINKLQDAHSTYFINCYKSYVFTQPIALYAPVVNGVQSIRVLYDDTNSDMEECQVDTINGRDAFEYIHDWAVAETGYSKDPGVRLNFALGGIIYLAGGQFGPMYGAFGQRAVLPSSPVVNYTFTCQRPEGARSYELSAAWRPSRSRLAKPFHDAASFYQNCLSTPEPKPTHDLQSIHSVPDAISLEREMERELALMHRHLPHKFEQHLGRLAAAPAIPESRRPPMNNAIVVATTLHTAMYQLQSQPDVGVVVVPSMLIEAKEYPQILKGLEALARRNVNKIILDLSNNGGGFVDFSSALTSWFFPSAQGEDLSNSGDFRVTNEVQRISNMLVARNITGSIFTPSEFVDPTTDQEFTTNFFMHPVQITRGGLQDTYTPKVEDKVTLLPHLPNFPWSNNPANIKILTDGQCGSSCTLSASVLTHRFGVDSYAAGGYQGKTLSAYSFAGGTIQNWQDVYKIYYDTLGLGVEVPNFSAPPLNGTYNVATYEVYIDNDPLPLDYSPQRFPAKYQINYTSETMRHPDVLWGVLANHAWPTNV
ncbi:hypothetical protein BGZ73_003970 [Actinomortierella ambigua]|nr:hypothetical protein BGZ73_003970 [Actinomortierella ambigua]